MDDKDRELVEKAMQNDTNAMEELYNTYNERLYGYFYRRNFKKLYEPQELVNETWIRAFSGLKGVDFGEGSFSRWLFGIASNVIIATLRDSGRVIPISALNENESATGSDRLSFIEWERIENEDTPLIEDEEIFSIVLEIVDALPEDYREPLKLYALEGFTYTEIAEKLQISLGNVKARISRARERVKQNFKKRYGDLEVIL